MSSAPLPVLLPEFLCLFSGRRPHLSMPVTPIAFPQAGRRRLAFQGASVHCCGRYWRILAIWGHLTVGSAWSEGSGAPGGLRPAAMIAANFFLSFSTVSGNSAARLVDSAGSLSMSKSRSSASLMTGGVFGIFPTESAVVVEHEFPLPATDGEGAFV